ncbi:hypothetical protein CNMCM5878_002508 [Aspergillus fumigatiaffinis]|nr:hypothetical protein CNMCM5878_002508 [Aspergillus fumigatiaffinis]
MGLPAPSTPAGWLFTVLALLDVPMLVHQLFNPKSNSQYFLISALLAIVLLAMTAYDLTAALNNDRTFLWVSCAARCVGFLVLFQGGVQWRKKAVGPGVVTALIALTLWFS